MESHPIRAGRETFTGRVMLTGDVVHLPDVLADPDYDFGEGPELGNYRAALGVPLLREGRVDGFVLARPVQESDVFSPRQIELLRAFADQAAIAIENVRLFDEVQARTRDLTEALQQQTATADILKVIASSPSDVQPVFDAVADRAMRLLKCWSVVVTRYDGEQLHFGAACGALPDTEAYVRRLFPQRSDPEGFYGRCILDKCPVNDPDRQSCPDPKGREYARVRGFHSALAVPMLAECSVIGLITATRETAGAFAEEDVRLLRTFADQAAIAINNVSLFNETQEALKQQTATADVLKVISRSAFDLKTVLRTLVRSAVDLCGADNGVIFLRLGEFFYFEEGYGLTPEVERFMQGRPFGPGRRSVVARVALSGSTEAIPDVLADPEFEFPATLNRARSLLGVPLLRDNRVEGVFVMIRPEPGHFATRLIELVQTFADQAVIAIENVRLFDEVQARTRDLIEALQQQTATADVLKVISRSAFDLQPVFDTLVHSAAELSGAERPVFHRDGDAATNGFRTSDFRPICVAYAVSSSDFAAGFGSTTSRAGARGNDHP